MPEHGLFIKPGNEMTRMELACEHQRGVLYMAPGERSWVCPPATRHAHALAGLFKELARLNDPRIQEAMQHWGVYFREMPLASHENARLEMAEGEGQAPPKA